MPTTEKQLRLYQALEQFSVDYMLVGALAAMFYGRNRTTGHIDLFLPTSAQNTKKLVQALENLGYVVRNFNWTDLQNYKHIQIGGEAIINCYSEYDGVFYEDVEKQEFTYEGIPIQVIKKPHLIKLLQTTAYHGEDVKVLRLLDDPIKNKDEINDRQ